MLQIPHKVLNPNNLFIVLKIKYIFSTAYDIFCFFSFALCSEDVYLFVRITLGINLFTFFRVIYFLFYIRIQRKIIKYD